MARTARGLAAARGSLAAARAGGQTKTRATATPDRCQRVLGRGTRARLGVKVRELRGCRSSHTQKTRLADALTARARTAGREGAGHLLVRLRSLRAATRMVSSGAARRADRAGRAPAAMTTMMIARAAGAPRRLRRTARASDRTTKMIVAVPAAAANTSAAADGLAAMMMMTTTIALRAWARGGDRRAKRTTFRLTIALAVAGTLRARRVAMRTGTSRARRALARVSAAGRVAMTMTTTTTTTRAGRRARPRRVEGTAGV